MPRVVLDLDKLSKYQNAHLYNNLEIDNIVRQYVSFEDMMKNEFTKHNTDNTEYILCNLKAYEIYYENTVLTGMCEHQRRLLKDNYNGYKDERMDISEKVIDNFEEAIRRYEALSKDITQFYLITELVGSKYILNQFIDKCKIFTTVSRLEEYVTHLREEACIKFKKGLSCKIYLTTSYAIDSYLNEEKKVTRNSAQEWYNEDSNKYLSCCLVDKLELGTEVEVSKCIEQNNKKEGLFRYVFNIQPNKPTTDNSNDNDDLKMQWDNIN